ncbi:glycosyltransferase family 2 protein [Thermococcus sibiricus]|uniref:Dolichol-phosphate mannosyltransferase n=1 Tax=Thermococcus sibiricus TaxID=172049 RepID=A0A101EKK9_9EURY|nr:glycosyltransferase family 2 protein [Thermococcus sibiricus]KUK16864.1 MAG: Dolichol-phosphate mannosyltransferase [Thermococcus sibiricus]
MVEESSRRQEDLDLSVVIPVFNEEENLLELYGKLKEVLERTGRSYEIIFVDDGSTDRSLEILKSIHEIDRRVKVIRFRKNFGQTAVLSAGFDHAKGKIIVTMDADLQNDPEDIPLLLGKIEEGYDVVSGWRADRKDPISKKIPSRISNWLASKLTGLKLHDFGCTLKAYRKEIIKNVRLYGDHHRYIPALASWQGAKIAEVKVRHHPRKHGKSKYGFKRLLRGFLDLIVVKFLVDYSTRPMHFFGILGLLLILGGFILGLSLVIERFLFHISLSDRPLLLLAVLLIIVGLQFLMIGLIGELVIRTYFETHKKPTYVIEEVIE